MRPWVCSMSVRPYSPDGYILYVRITYWVYQFDHSSSHLIEALNSFSSGEDGPPLWKYLSPRKVVKEIYILGFMMSVRYYGISGSTVFTNVVIWEAFLHGNRFSTPLILI